MRGIDGDVAVAVVRNNGEYLMVKRSDSTSSAGKWTFPGGKIEERDETEREAALRELEEETGLQGYIIREGEPYIDEGEIGLWRLFPFLVEVDSREVDLDHEHSECRWLELEEIHEIDHLGKTKGLERLDLL